jgi:hypothetical protein
LQTWARFWPPAFTVARLRKNFSKSASKFTSYKFGLVFGLHLSRLKKGPFSWGFKRFFHQLWLVFSTPPARLLVCEKKSAKAASNSQVANFGSFLASLFHG